MWDIGAFRYREKGFQRSYLPLYLAGRLHTRLTAKPEEVDMHIVWSIIIGFIVGLVARFALPGRDNMGLLFTALLGIVGALIATILGQGLGWYNEGEPAGFIASVVGAMLVLFVARSVRSRSAVR